MENGRIPGDDLWTASEDGRLPEEDPKSTEAAGGQPAAGRRSTAADRRPPRAHVRKAAPRKFKINYRMALCIAVLACFLLAVLFFALFLGQRGKAKGLADEKAKLTEEKTALTQQIGTLTQENQTMLAGVLSSAPDPTTANTQSLSDLIPQLTEGVYLIRSTGEGLQYLQVPAGYLTDRLAAFRDDKAGFKPAEAGASADWIYWVLFDDRVIGMSDQDRGFVSTDRTATGTEYELPQGFSAFVASIFEKKA